MKKLKYALIAVLAIAGIAATLPSVSNSTETSNDQVAQLRIGDPAPELAFLDPEGKERKLSDLRGKVVLIDFWASWCGPCRMENPNVVKLYNNYKDKKFKSGKGFEIFSVSLDQSKDRWIGAIKQDGLIWENHVSDLQGWRAEGARIYNVNSIPQTYLIDGEGKIIAKGLRGAALENQLKSLLK